MLLAILLSFLMCMSLVPMTAIAGTGDVAIDETNFPDLVFLNEVRDAFDKNKDGILSQAERESVDEIDVHGPDKGIKSLKGLEFFPNLKKLNCSYNFISNLDVSKNPNLEELVCYNNSFNTLDLSKNLNLKYIHIYSTRMTTLDVSKNQKLEKLYCGHGDLKSIILSEKPNLKELSCDDNKLTTLDVSKAPNLEIIECYKNQLTTLDISKNPKLTKLDCSYNLFNTLDVSKNSKLARLFCGNNKLKTLNVQNNLELESLYCDENELTELDINNNLKLRSFDCRSNKLTAIDVSKNLELRTLDVSSNDLTVLDTSKNQHIGDFRFANNHLTSTNLNPMAVIGTLVGGGNKYDIEVKELTRTFDLTSLPGNFVVSKASNWKGGTVSGNILTIDDTKPYRVTYEYEIGTNNKGKKVTEYFSLIVNYKKEYTVSFDKNGGSGSMPEVKKTAGEIYVLPACAFTAPAGKEFKAWEVNGVEKAVGDNIQINANTTVKAIWKTATYTVSFDKNGGSGSMADVKKLAGETYKLPACTFTAPAGKEFKAWEVNGAEKAVGDNIQVNANTTVKAIWKAATYTVSFDKNGGSGSMADVKKLAGETYTLPTCTFTAPTGKEFKAWEVNGAEKQSATTFR